MTDKIETLPEPSVMRLVGGIITDVHALIEQQLALFRLELTGKINHTREAAMFLAAGMSIGIVGGGLLGVMLVHGIAQLVPDLPLWSCYAIVGLPVAGLGFSLCMIGAVKFGSVHAPMDQPGRALEKDYLNG